MMRKLQLLASAAVFGLALLLCTPAAAQRFALDSTAGLDPHGVTVAAAEYQGRKAVRLEPARPAGAELVAPRNREGGGLAVVPNSSFENGTIEVWVAGRPRPGANQGARGFVGVAFRVGAGAKEYECFYIRPTNGRADDQLRRNHSTQYISMPDYDWATLRRNDPGKYESYTDLQPGEWTRLKIEVEGTRARLYVNGSPQPVLIVNDLKHGDSSGAVALWIGMGTEAYFSDLQVEAAKPATSMR